MLRGATERGVEAVSEGNDAHGAGVVGGGGSGGAAGFVGDGGELFGESVYFGVVLSGCEFALGGGRLRRVASNDGLLGVKNRRADEAGSQSEEDDF